MTPRRPETGYGTGNIHELIVRVSVGTSACKVIVQRPGETALIHVVCHKATQVVRKDRPIDPCWCQGDELLESFPAIPSQRGFLSEAL